ncbi:hypothetical protein C8R46DRAFT_1218863 [Mycena filopes]|nr:hypothetical protein C8R46DRAFT_1218863 [Mycena filopes]
MLDAALVVCEEEQSSAFDVDHVVPTEGKKNTTSVIMQGENSPRDSEPSAIKALMVKLDKLEADTQAAIRKDSQDKEDYRKAIQTELANVFSTHMDKFTANQHKEMQQLRIAVEGPRSDPGIQPSYNRAPGQPMPSFTRNRSTNNTMECYYCYEAGHFINACPNLAEDVQKGIVRHEGGRIKFFDSKNCPREPPGKSPRSKALEYYERRTVSGNYDEIWETFFGNEEEETSVSHGSSMAKEDDKMNQVLIAIERLSHTHETRSKSNAAADEVFQ